MKNYIFLVFCDGYEPPVGSIGDDNVSSDFDEAFDKLTHYALCELQVEHIRKPRKPRPFNLSVKGHHLQIWEANIPERTNE